MSENLIEKLKTFLNTDEEWHYFWLGFFTAGSLYNLILFIHSLFF